ncbi:MAG TPA: sterol desaturase family protein, partial [Stellaceae bacterium]|nr:sterol desaturase family protein [Stellaceae bacterium]
VIVTPSIHWVHHHRLRADTDSNYCTILSLWDPLFRSRSPHRRTPDMAIGVEAQEEEPVLQLLVAPFR